MIDQDLSAKEDEEKESVGKASSLDFPFLMISSRQIQWLTRQSQRKK